MNECDLLLPCQHNATCEDLLNDYTCTCLEGFTGKNCSTNIDDCIPNPCYHGSQCNDGVDSYTCSCSPGYTGIVLNPFQANGIFHKATYDKVRMVHCTVKIEAGHTLAQNLL